MTGSVYLQRRRAPLEGRDGELRNFSESPKLFKEKWLRVKKPSQNPERVFVRFLLLGKVSAALRWIGNHSKGPLEVTDYVLNILREKHPKANDMINSAELKGPVQAVEKVLFDGIDGGMIYAAAFTIKLFSILWIFK